MKDRAHERSFSGAGQCQKLRNSGSGEAVGCGCGPPCRRAGDTGPIWPAAVSVLCLSCVCPGVSVLCLSWSVLCLSWSVLCLSWHAHTSCPGCPCPPLCVHSKLGHSKQWRKWPGENEPSRIAGLRPLQTATKTQRQKIRGNFRRSQAQFFGQIFGDFECQKSEVIRIAIAVLREP